MKEKPQRQQPDGVRNTITRREFRGMLDIIYGVRMAGGIYKTHRDYWRNEVEELPFGTSSWEELGGHK